MRPISKIIVQIVDIESVEELTAKHMKEGMPMVGFHYMIEKDASVHYGRSINDIGNHCINENAVSIGIAVIGDRDSISFSQKNALDMLIEEIELKAPDVKDILIVEGEELKKYK